MSPNPIVWSPSQERARATAMFAFMRQNGFENYESLYRWSIDESQEFWPALCEFCDVRFERPASRTLTRPDNIMDAGWFAGSELNFAANLLRDHDNDVAIVFYGEDGARTEVSRPELRKRVASMAAALAAAGLEKGDRVAACLPNCPEAIIAMLATASVGAIWSSCSPDFGVNGIVDRFGQIQPKILLGANGYRYNGKIIDTRPTILGVAEEILSVQRVVVVPFVATLSTEIDLPSATGWNEFCDEDAALVFTPVAFDHPLYILFSSGTTGVPKCIVHGHGGTLLQHVKEHVLHTDIGPDDRLFYFTTCGWMMWNWLASGLASGATLLLFDGAPFFNDGRILWQMAEKERVTVFGTSAKYLSALEKAGVRPADEFSLPDLRAVLSTGSPLAPASFDYVYDAIGRDLQLSSIAGGTDILGCFARGNPLLPVRRGELQGRGLGMAAEILNEDGQPVVAERGELVCTRPFPSAPVGFWNDDDRSLYHAAYFDRFEGVWAHGDFAELTENGGLIFHGRSDAILNPGGVRIGTSEIYRQVEKLDEVIESIAIGQRWQDDERVVLFVVLRPDVLLDDALQQKIRSVIRDNTTPRHVPAVIADVPEIPRTRSGKIVELAVRAVVHGEAVSNTEAIANPEALAYFRDIPQLSAEPDDA